MLPCTVVLCKKKKTTVTSNAMLTPAHASREVVLSLIPSRTVLETNSEMAFVENGTCFEEDKKSYLYWPILIARCALKNTCLCVAVDHYRIKAKKKRKNT